MAQTKKKQQVSTLHLLSVGSGVLLVLGIGLAIRSSFEQKPETPACEARYAGGVLFSYARSGEGPLAPEDLQARLAGRDRGLVANSKIVEDASVLYGYALEVQLKKGAPESDDQTRSGIGFTWAPRQLTVATGACLSYNVWVPQDFQTGDGGILPGLVSDIDTIPSGGLVPVVDRRSATEGESAEAGEPEELKPFSIRPQWRPDGAFMMWSGPNVGQAGNLMLDPQKAMLKKGVWSRIEQEAVLNSPGKHDGVLRMWVNGKLVLERFDIAFRKSDLQSFQAVAGDVHHIRNGIWAPSPADMKMRISPLELRLR
jgi:hypothetical protein